MHRVFVYGTLKRGFPNHDDGLANAAYLGRFRTVDAYPLIVGGKWFSPYLIDEPGQGLQVWGEVFAMDEGGLETLDLFEGAHLPNGYRRITIVVEGAADKRRFDAFTYVKDRTTIDGIHSEPMEEYGLDPRYVGPAKRPRIF